MSSSLGAETFRSGRQPRVGGGDCHTIAKNRLSRTLSESARVESEAAPTLQALLAPLWCLDPSRLAPAEPTAVCLLFNRVHQKSGRA
jgi:hypothetical protein